jgi:hypothetical protein
LTLSTYMVLVITSIGLCILFWYIYKNFILASEERAARLEFQVWLRDIDEQLKNGKTTDRRVVGDEENQKLSDNLMKRMSSHGGAFN